MVRKKSLSVIFLGLGLAFTLPTLFVLWQSDAILGTDNVQKISNKPITFGISQEAENLLIMIADEYGFFSQEGLDVSLMEYPSGKRSLNEGLFAGETDFATPADVPIVFGSFERKDFSVITNLGYSDNISKIVARADKGVSKPSDLVGKKIATQKESSVHFFLYLFLLKHNIPEKNVQVSYKLAEELPIALANGEIDGFSMREPFISEARELLGDKIVVFEEPGLYQKVYSLVAFNKFIEENPGVITKVLRALLKAEQFVQENPEKSIKLVSKKTGIPESEIAANWQNFGFKVSIGQTFLRSLDEHARWAINNEMVSANKVPNYLDYIHSSSLSKVKPDAIRTFGS